MFSSSMLLPANCHSIRIEHNNNLEYAMPSDVATHWQPVDLGDGVRACFEVIPRGGREEVGVLDAPLRSSDRNPRQKSSSVGARLRAT